ncbi:MAG TPA: ribosomal-processing cysteine protease Prp [Spirochaetota bacterium]|nr:ribosomal-processing cysteine protease Prp [Spirochaetota bacterium]
MIVVDLEFDRAGILNSVKSRGHAPVNGFLKWLGFAGKYNAVCAAVSTLEYTLFYSIQELTAARIEADIKKGSYSLHILNYDTACDDIKLLGSSFILGIEAVASRYKKIIKLHKGYSNVK